MTATEGDILWCLRMFSLLTLGGQWIVPRSGLIFEKASLSPPTLKLVRILDGYDREEQEADFATISDRMTAAEIKVERSDDLN